MTCVLALLLLGAPSPEVVLHLDQAAGLDEASTAAVLKALAREVELRSGTSCVLDALDWPGCFTDRACIKETLRRAGTQEGVFIELVAGNTKLRIKATRTASAGDVFRQTDLPLPLTDLTPLRSLAAGLYPAPIAVRPLLAPPPPEALRFIGPLVVTSAGAIGLGVSAYLGRQSDALRREYRSSGLNDDEPAYQSYTSRITSKAAAANVLFDVALTTIGLGVLWFLADNAF